MSVERSHCQGFDTQKRIKATAKNADRDSMAKIVIAVLLIVISTIYSAYAADSGSLRLSGQVDPQLNVTTTLDWANWILRLDNASNVENDTYWIDIGSSQRIRLERTAVVDLASWVGRGRALSGKQLLVTIASP